MTVQTFVIPEPPSVNNLFRNVPRKGRVKTERYNIWMQAAQWDVLLEGNGEIRSRRKIEKLTGSVEISIEMGKCRGDIDNRAKPVLDLMVKCGVIGDDKQVQMLAILRDSDLKKRTIVTVRPFEKIQLWPTRSANS